LAICKNSDIVLKFFYGKGISIFQPYKNCVFYGKGISTFQPYKNCVFYGKGILLFQPCKKLRIFMVNLLKEEKSIFGQKKNHSTQPVSGNDPDIFNTEEKEKKSADKEIQKNQAEKNAVYDLPIQKADINRYVDQSGITMKKLKLGLWFVENRKSMITLGYGLLIIIGVLTWSSFFYHFGYYFIIGMRADEKLVSEIISQGAAGHEHTLNNAAVNLQLDPVEIIRLDGDKYDLVARAVNPNKNHWTEFTYSFTIDGKEYGKTEAFILPGETKYLIGLGIDPESGIADVRLKLSDVKWSRVDKHVYPDWEAFRNNHMDIEVTDIDFVPARAANLSEKINLSELSFKVNNKSAYNYWKLDLLILLFNRNRIVGIQKNVLDSFKSDESRVVRLALPGFLEAVHSIEVIPELNITKDDIYMKFEGGNSVIR
jgi:hypothetical protein